MGASPGQGVAEQRQGLPVDTRALAFPRAGHVQDANPMPPDPDVDGGRIQVLLEVEDQTGPAVARRQVNGEGGSSGGLAPRQDQRAVRVPHIPFGPFGIDI